MKIELIFQKRYQLVLDYLRECRERSNLTQAQVAKKLGTYPAFMSKVESGEKKLNLVELWQILSLYDVDPVTFSKEISLLTDKNNNSKKR